jgi:alpha-tubulin suppressor-like RCC1 family protein
MTRSFLAAFASLAVALSMTFATDTEAENNNPSLGGTGKSVSAWGYNWFGQLGDGTTFNRDTPVQVQNLSGVAAVAGSSVHSLALKSDGTVWAWGYNGVGQLGDGTTFNRDTPVQVQNLSGVTAVAGGGGHSLALKSDGTVWAWGYNRNGQLGDGTTFNRDTPVRVQNLSGVTAVAGGASHSLALESNGTVWAWGDNAFGELGDGTHTDQVTPVWVQNLWFGFSVTAVAGSSVHSLALKSDGTVWAWGSNNYGELGDGTTFNRDTPVQVQNLSGVTAVAGGASHSLALKSDGTVWAWGDNQQGQLGDGTTFNRHTPVPVQNLRRVTGVAAGDGHSLAVLGTYLNVRDILVHPDTHRPRLFNLRIDGVVVRANDNGGNTGFQLVSPGNHTVSETGGTGTPIGAFGTVIGGDCAADGIVNLAPGDQKTCTITNYDHTGGCPSRAICCEPGDGTQGCLRCSKAGHGCP